MYGGPFRSQWVTIMVYILGYQLYRCLRGSELSCYDLYVDFKPSAFFTSKVVFMPEVIPGGFSFDLHPSFLQSLDMS